MNGLFLALMMSTTIVAEPVALAEPELAAAVVVDAANDAAVETDSFTPDVGDWICVLCLSRDGGTGTHGTPVATGFTMAGPGFTQRDTDEVNATNYFRITAWDGVVATSASGTLTVTASEAQFQQILIVLIIPGAAAFQTSGTAKNTTGTTLNVDYDATPDSGALGIAAFLQSGTGGTGMAATGYTDSLSISGTQSTNCRWFVGFKLGTPTDPAAGTGMQTDVEHVGLVLAYTGAA